MTLVLFKEWFRFQGLLSWVWTHKNVPFAFLEWSWAKAFSNLDVSIWVINPLFFLIWSILSILLCLFSFLIRVFNVLKDIFKRISWNFIYVSFSSFEIKLGFAFKQVNGPSILSFCCYNDLLDSKAMFWRSSSISSQIQIISSAVFISFVTQCSYALLMSFLTYSGYWVENIPQKKSLGGT